MSGDVTVTSTTDTQEAVDAAASYGNLAVEQPDVEKAGPSVADEAETVAKSEPAPEEEPEKEVPEEGEEEEEEEESPEQAIGKTRREMRRALSRLTSQKYVLREQLEIANQRIRQLERPGKEEPAAAAPSSDKPQRHQFATDEAYVEGLVNYELNRRAQAEAQARFQEYQQEILTDYSRQLETARTEHEDYDEVVGVETKIPEIAIPTMKEMPNGAEVAYYLAKNPEVRERLLELNTPYLKGGQARIVAELYKISNELSGSNGNASRNGSPKPSRVRTAPAPISPVGGGATRSAVPPDQMPFRDFKKWREQNGARR